MDAKLRAPRRTRLAALALALALVGCTVQPGSPSGAQSPGAPGQVGTSGEPAAGHDTGWVSRENALPGTPGWESAEATYAGDFELAAFFGQVSVTPGEDATMYATSKVGDFDVHAYRLGWYGGAGAREVWRSTSPVVGVEQADPLKAPDKTITAPWTPTVTIPTKGWPEGSYLVKLSAEGGTKTRYVPLTVRSESVHGRLVVLSPALTQQAYNAWGGYSIYHGPDGRYPSRSLRVSFDRPYDRNGAMETFKFEVPVVQFAERLGLDLAYTTTWDVDQRPGSLDGARGIVSEGHDEYWSVPVRDAVEQARSRGTNLAFLGANAVYWRVRLEDGPLGTARTMAAYKDPTKDPVQGETTTTLWRAEPGARPENSLTGMLYECYPASGALRVENPDSFLLAGTGATAGKTYPGLVGSEIDRAYPIPGTPDTLEVVAHSPVRCRGVGNTYSDVTYYTDPSGAGVFAAGTMMWTNALAGRTSGTGVTDGSVAFTRQVTENLLRAMAAGPMGKAHPSRPNLAELKAPKNTGTGSGGPYTLPSATPTPGTTFPTTPGATPGR